MSNLNVIKFNGYDKVKLVKWKIKKGTTLSTSTVLFTYNEHGVEKRFKSDEYGTVVRLLINENEFINPNQDLIEYERCAHTTVMKDLCAECGMDLRKTDNYENNASVSMIHSVPELKVSLEQAHQLGKADEEKLLSSRKLVLLVDLDQTLIHTTHEPNNQINSKDVISFRLYHSNSLLYYTKLRPFTQEFLEFISKHYELHICTFGARMYAHKIAEILDPDKRLFSHRILSRDECFDPKLKTGNLKALFPCGDSMVCIIDDRDDVWNFQPNLIQVKPYNYFKDAGDINSPNKEKDDLLAKAAKVLSGRNKDKDDEENVKDDESEAITKASEDKETKSDSEVVKDAKANESTSESTKKQTSQTEQKDHDDYLLYLRDILERIHRKFYKEYDEIVKYSAEGEHIKIPDLKQLIPSIRRETLKGVNIVFTGLIPNNFEPERSKLWTVAKELGANVRRDLVKEGSPLEKTTHLIASNLNTEKVKDALKLKRVHVVNPIWLYTCSERWERVDESLFSLEKDDDFRNPDKLKNKLTFDQQLFLNYDLVKLSTLSKSSSRQLKGASSKPPTSDTPESKASNLNKQSFPIYDSVTGKLIRPSTSNQTNDQPNNQPSTSFKQLAIDLSKNDESFLNNEEESLTPHSMIEMNPLSGFSNEDFKMMNQEVDDACSDEDDSSEDSLDQRLEEEENQNLDDDDDNFDNEIFGYGDDPGEDEPAAKRCRRDPEYLSESSESSEDTSNLSCGDSNSNAELAAALEKDFLG